MEPHSTRVENRGYHSATVRPEPRVDFKTILGSFEDDTSNLIISRPRNALSRLIASLGRWDQKLITASAMGDVNGVKNALPKVSNINRKNRDGNTALHVATIGGYADVIEILLESRAGINMHTEIGKTALFIAVEKGPERLSIVRILLQNKADVHRGKYRLSKSGFYIDETPLEKAIRDQMPNLVELLLKNGASTEITYQAVLRSRYDMSKDPQAYAMHLENYKASQSWKYIPKKTPLFSAAETGSKDIVKLLLEFGADVNSTNDLDVKELCSQQHGTATRILSYPYSNMGQLRF